MRLLDLQKYAQKCAKNATKTMAKTLACSAVLAGVLSTNASAIGIGSFKINPDFGVSAGVNAHDGSVLNNAFLLGGYARVWMGGKGLTFAPMVKYNYVFGKDNVSGFGNLQAGGVIGYNILRLTPYIGGSYSRFDKIGYEDTAAINYGINFDIPVLPLSVGLDASSQNPKIIGSARAGWQHQIAVTLGFYF
ncbi:hypothetical protein [Helicobacter sp. T3_23-1059]